MLIPVSKRFHFHCALGLGRLDQVFNLHFFFMLVLEPAVIPFFLFPALAFNILRFDCDFATVAGGEAADSICWFAFLVVFGASIEITEIAFGTKAGGEEGGVRLTSFGFPGAGWTIFLETFGWRLQIIYVIVELDSLIALFIVLVEHLNILEKLFGHFQIILMCFSLFLFQIKAEKAVLDICIRWFLPLQNYASS